jgi:glutathione-independent formaldehyde dehydrogenase
MLSDIFPTGYHGCVSAGVGTGSTVYIAGAGPVGLGAAASALLLGAAAVIVGDMQPERLEQARSFGCETIDLTKIEDNDGMEQALQEILGVPEAPAVVLNTVMGITRAGGKVGIPGLYVPSDPGAADDSAKHGNLSLQFGIGWAKSLQFMTGQAPVMKYHRELMQAILNDRVQIGKAVNATVISLEDAPQGYADFDSGAAEKFVLDPHGMLNAA